MTILKVDSVDKQFGNLIAVSNASFDIADGEFVSILGPSGSGKSTILRMIAGFEKPTNGEIYINGQDVTDTPPFERDTNMVFQGLALFPHLTVAENIEYGLKNKGKKSNDREKNIKSMLDTVQLSGYGDRSPDQLSGGEQQRVALARALVNEPAIVLFDEPLASLDRKLRQHMQIELQRIQSQTDTTFLYVTHDQEVAMAVSDRLILLNDGEIEQIGAVKQLYEEPVSQFVADFIGDVNTIPAIVSSQNDSLIVEAAESDTKFSLDAAHQNRNFEMASGDKVYICVRPHDVTLTEDEPQSALAMPGRIRNRIYQGNEVHYTLNTDVGQITVNTDNEDFQIDDSVYATWPASETYLFSINETEVSSATIGTQTERGTNQ